MEYESYTVGRYEETDNSSSSIDPHSVAASIPIVPIRSRTLSALDVLVVRVHKLVPKDVWKPRYDFINEWEKLLAIENSTTILKFFLYISREKQLTRFKERLDDPGRQRKISNSDYT